MEKLLDELKEKLIIHLKRNGDLDKPYIFKGPKSFSKNDIINEVQNGTEDGNEFINDIVILSLDLFDRGKEKFENHEKV